MNRLLLFLLIYLLSLSLSSQSCLPEGITFSLQEQIDEFQKNYPGCSQIEGDITITGEDIYNLNGLNVINIIEGDLIIELTTQLNNFSGLENLNTVEGNFIVGRPPEFANLSLINFEGLNNLSFVGKNFYITNNDLESFTGLENLDSIGGSLTIGDIWWEHYSLTIHDNPNLTSLSGLNNLIIVGRDIKIVGNAFTNFDGLNNLTTVQRNISISYSDLINFSGLNSFNFLGGDLIIFKNQALTNLIGLDNLTSINGNLEIGGYGIDLFGDSHYFGNPALLNLTGLNNLTNISKNLYIGFNHELIDLTGIENLEIIGGDLILNKNLSLTNLDGLNKLTTVDSSIIIGGSYEDASGIKSLGNPSLKNLSGIDSLKVIGKDLWIESNDSLSNLLALNRLEHINGNLIIIDNSILAYCEARSICNYLANPPGTFEIRDNDNGCNNEIEIEESCASFITSSFTNKLSVTPNPFTTSSRMSYELQKPESISLSIYNHLGQIVHQVNESQPPGTQQLIWRAETYPEGVYYYSLKLGDAVANGKMVKVR